MIGPLRPRTALLLVIAAATVLAMVPVFLLVCIERDGADGSALDALVAAVPSLPEPRIENSGAPALPPVAREAGASIEGRVVTESGKPVPGAWVCLLPDGQRLRTDGVAHAPCSEDGSFAIGGLSAGSWLPHVMADGLIALPQPALALDVAQHLRDVRLVVATADALSGRMHVQDGSTPDELGWGDVPEEHALRGKPPTRACRLVTSADTPRCDRFTWPEPPPGVFTVETVFGTTAVAEVRAGETTVVDFVVPRAIVSGVVLAGGQPVAGAVVKHQRLAAWALCHLCASFRGSPVAETATTDADGRFEQSIPCGADIALWAVTPDGAWSTEARVSLTASRRFEVGLVFPSGTK